MTIKPSSDISNLPPTLSLFRYSDCISVSNFKLYTDEDYQITFIQHHLYTKFRRQLHISTSTHTWLQKLLEKCYIISFTFGYFRIVLPKPNTFTN